jgi:PIN domain nuclease of toxin-antitoxin system
MKYLLDTMAVLRLAAGEAPPKVVRRIERAETLLVSVVTLWEIAMRRLPGITQRRFAEAIEHLAADLLPITILHCEMVGKLPEFREHRDPFDRMIIAQAIEERCPVVSGDQKFALYRGAGLEVLW